MSRKRERLVPRTHKTHAGHSPPRGNWPVRHGDAWRDGSARLDLIRSPSCVAVFSFLYFLFTLSCRNTCEKKSKVQTWRRLFDSFDAAVADEAACDGDGVRARGETGMFDGPDCANGDSGPPFVIGTMWEVDLRRLPGVLRLFEFKILFYVFYSFTHVAV